MKNKEQIQTNFFRSASSRLLLAFCIFAVPLQDGAASTEEHTTTLFDPVNLLVAMQEELDSYPGHTWDPPKYYGIKEETPTNDSLSEKGPNRHPPKDADAAAITDVRQTQSCTVGNGVDQNNSTEPNAPDARKMEDGKTPQFKNGEGVVEFNSDILSQLISIDYGAPPNAQVGGKDAELYGLINRIRSLRFNLPGTSDESTRHRGTPSRQQHETSAAANEPALQQSETIPGDVEAEKLRLRTAADKAHAKQDVSRPDGTEVAEKVTDFTLQKIALALQDTSKLKDPLELAEVLFLSGRLTEACALYKEALKYFDRDDSSHSEDRAWILFQIGNCLRSEEPQTAAGFYGQLIKEHPDSLWSGFAQIWQQLAQWRQQDKPEILMRQKDPTGHNKAD